MANQVPVDTQKVFKTTLLVEPDRYAYQYVNGNRTDNKTGVVFPCVLPDFKYEKVNVRVENPALPLLFPEGTEFPDEAPELELTGLEATATSSRDEFGVRINATAKAVRIKGAAATVAASAPKGGVKDDK